MTDPGMPERPPQRIAVLRALVLGDMLVAAPALAALRSLWPEAQIDLIGLPWAEEFVRRWGVVNSLVRFQGHAGIPESPAASTAQRFNANASYDLAIQLHGSGQQSNDVVQGLEAGWTVGYGPSGDRRLDVVLPWNEEENEIDRWLRVVEALGCSVADREIPFPLSTDERRRAQLLLAEATQTRGPFVGLHVGAKDERRRWPILRFAALAERLARELGARMVLTGGADDAALTAEVARMARVPLLDLAGATKLGEYGAVIESLDLLVTNDTSASHVAAATRTPSVVLFGPTEPRRWAPIDRERHRVIRGDSNGAAERPDVQSIPVDAVFEAASGQLRRFSGPMSSAGQPAPRHVEVSTA